MPDKSFISAVTGESRVFLIAGRARPDHEPEYIYFGKLGSVTKPFGDVTPIRLPSKTERNKFPINRQVRGTEDNVTSQIMTRYARNVKSRILQLAKQGCPVDMIVPFGECSDPSQLDVFSKAIFFEDVTLTNYSTDDFGALDSDEQAKIDETVDFAASTFYESVYPSFKQVGGASITNEVLAIAKCDGVSCGECADESDGCQRFYSITKAAGGSVSTQADIIFTKDAFKNLKFDDIDSMNTSDDPSDVDCVDDYVVVVSNDSNSAHVALKSEFELGLDPDFTEVTTGFVVGGEPNAISSYGTGAFIVGDFGYIYEMLEPTAGVVVKDAGEATIAVLNAVHAISEDYAVAVGNDGAIVYTEDGDIWGLSPSSPVGVGVNINDVWVKSEDEWFVVCSNGTIYYTLNRGVSWTQITLPGTTPTSLQSVKMPSDSIMYVTGVVSGNGRIWRSNTGGYSFKVLPVSQGVLPASDQLNDIAVCETNVDFVAAVGLADDGSDGVIIVGDSN